jgi:hypothetical protein
VDNPLNYHPVKEFIDNFKTVIGDTGSFGKVVKEDSFYSNVVTFEKQPKKITVNPVVTRHYMVVDYNGKKLRIRVEEWS